ncbi:MAG: IPTL-CTERM sorting domain-containing protein [Ottowia sp.]|nr:IPTL-CTERM sorting domain-containing protein [Ottowia sp.]
MTIQSSFRPLLSAPRRCVALAAALALSGAAQAATLTVTTGADNGAGSLRALLASAAEGDTIVFAPGVTTVTLAGTELAFNQSVTVKGPGVALDAGYRSRVLRVASGTTVRLEGLTVTGGALAGAGGGWGSVGGKSALGAGIHNSGALTLLDVTVRANAAGGGGSGGISGGGGALAGRLAPNALYVVGAGGVAAEGGAGFGGAGGLVGGDGGGSGAGKGGTQTAAGAGGTGSDYSGGGGAGFGGGGGGASGAGGGGGNGGANGNGQNGSQTWSGGGGGGGGGHSAVDGVAASGGGGTGTNHVGPADGGGGASGGIHNATGAQLVLLGASSLANNVAAGGGASGSGGDGGRGVGGLWNDGALYWPVPVLSGNQAASGGGTLRGISPLAAPHVYLLGSTLAQMALRVQVGGPGSVSASAGPTPVAGGVANCGSGGGAACQAGYGVGSPAAQVTLAATVPTGITFLGWNGACSGTATTCTVTMDGPQLAVASFALNQYPITATADPVAGGTVACSANSVAHGSGASCTAAPASGYALASFTGCSSTSGLICNVSNVQAPASVTAHFAPVITTFPGTTVPVSGPGGAASASFTGGGAACRFDAAATGFIAAVAPPPAGQSFPQGMFRFRLIGCDATPVTMAITWPDAVAGYTKWGKASGDPLESSSYFTPGNLSISGNTVSFTVQDGGPGDDDGPGNGTITDPTGPLTAVAVPTLGHAALLLLSLLTGGLAAWRRRPGKG